ncbi:MAG: formate dehydrogenase accessory sulfurtransferase FdhD [Pyrobaculum sp.]
MWSNHSGFKVAVDKLIKIYINDVLAAELVASPVELAELAVGYAYINGVMPEDIEIKGGVVKIYAQTAVGGKKVFEDCGPAEAVAKLPKFARFRWGQLMELAREFQKLTMPVVEPQLAMHTSALYVDGRWVVAHDVSRHSGVLKLVGKILLEGLPAYRAVAFTTGRASGDMVQRLALAAVPAVVSLRGPLYSGVEAACSGGMLLVANVRGVGFKPLCGEELLEY